MRRRLTATAIAAATLVAGAMVTATTPTASAGDGEDTVRLTIKVHGCPTCELGLVQLYDNDPDSYWSAPYQKVDDGKVVFDVPEDHARDLSVSIDAPWATAYVHGVQFVVMQYGGFEPGDRVSRREALHSNQGSRCWAGTSRDRTIHVKVVKKRYGSAPEVALRAWANPTLPATNMGQIHDGMIVTTYPACPAPS